jgi:aminoglycoside phosphotransferase (APT) family kinase protein
MSFLGNALDPHQADRQLNCHLPGLTRDNGRVRLCAIRVTRYKPGRRCLIEYDVEFGQRTRQTLVGKARANGRGASSYDLAKVLWDSGFASDSEDGITVPEPVGIIPEFQMWFQRKVPGVASTHLLADGDGVRLARRIAEAIHKLHRADVRAHCRHTMADELRILHGRLSLVAETQPQWAERLARLLVFCDRLGASAPVPSPCGIHRDFYADHVIVDGPRLYLLDFDLYCEGDPALDVGNFLGHLAEQSLRALGDPNALSDRAEALEERFLELSGERTRAAIRAYATLTLVRHIYVSTQFPERRRFTERLLELSEELLEAKHWRAR